VIPKLRMFLDTVHQKHWNSPSIKQLDGSYSKEMMKKKLKILDGDQLNQFHDIHPHSQNHPLHSYEYVTLCVRHPQAGRDYSI